MLDNICCHSIFVDPLVAAPPIILDLGANHGDFSKQMSERFGGKYFLVEANPFLAQTLKDEKQFHVWQCAVTSHDGMVEFNLAPNDVFSTVLQPSTPKGVGAMSCQKIMVPARNFESLLAEIPFSLIDLVKMDIEGVESQILLSLTPQTLRKIRQITVEFHCHESFGFNNREEVDKSIRYLCDQDFICLNFSGECLIDVLFINRRLNRIPFWKEWLWKIAATKPPWLKNMKYFAPKSLRPLAHQTLDWLAGKK